MSLTPNRLPAISPTPMAVPNPDIQLLEAALLLGRQIAGGVAHDLNSAMQGLGDSLYVIGEEFDNVLNALPPELTASGELADRIRESLQLADSAYNRLTSAGKGVGELLPPIVDVSQPIDLREELETLVTITSHQWKHRLDVSVVVDPSMPSFICNWWVARIAAARLFQIAIEAHPPRRGSPDRTLPRFRMTASESDGYVVLRVLCDQPSTDIAPPKPIAPRHSDATLQLCAARLNGEVSSVPCSLGSFGLAVRFPVRVALKLEEVASR